jgi:hypothetical protein
VLDFTCRLKFQLIINQLYVAMHRLMRVTTTSHFTQLVNFTSPFTNCCHMQPSTNSIVRPVTYSSAPDGQIMCLGCLEQWQRDTLQVLQGWLIPIINTTLIEFEHNRLSISSFSPCFFLKLNLLPASCKRIQIEYSPLPDS